MTMETVAEFGMVKLGFADGVAEVVLDAPKKLNVLNEQGLDDLSACLRAAGELDGVRALLLRGEGRGFCAGRDVSAVDPATDDVAGYLEGRMGPLMQLLSSFPAPTFCAVQGPCLGVGLGLAIACDVVYVADDAKLGSPFVNLGAVLDSGGHALFVERLGVHRTLDLIYTGELVSGAELVRGGVFSRSVPADELLDFTRRTIQKVAQGPTQALLASKRLVRRIEAEQLGLWDVLTVENEEQARLAAHDDYREGFRAFQEKRKPSFTGEA
ncbi:enoyl-CoA hydratase/isomerase family protein [Luteococcus sp. OSA5]|uniref:enoyl-CoA hydratase/isomerase family protein n=1 Tax=Luteococcus sp. OSA5 TaxID=3401630 RepID=UPI003B433CE8